MNNSLNSLDDDTKNRLGVDLAAAQMVLQIGGRVQFAGVDRWIERKGNSSSLPNYRVPDLRLQVVDFTNTKIIYEGLKSLGKNLNTFV